jgi:hypothetical protein
VGNVGNTSKRCLTGEHKLSRSYQVLQISNGKVSKVRVRPLASIRITIVRLCYVREFQTLIGYQVCKVRTEVGRQTRAVGIHN